LFLGDGKSGNGTKVLCRAILTRCSILNIQTSAAELNCALYMAGRPKTAVDVAQVIELTNAGEGRRTIAEKLGVSPSVVSRVQRAAGVLNRRRQPPKIIAITPTTLNKSDVLICVHAIGVAIEHEFRALDFCCQQLHNGSAALTEEIFERRRNLKQLRHMRHRLTRVS
jgi:hypothetical protein